MELQNRWCSRMGSSTFKASSFKHCLPTVNVKFPSDIALI